MAPGTFAMWWLGCTGIWVKSEGGTNISIDFWCGSGKKTHANPWMDPQHQMSRMCGGKKLQPNLRVAPFVLDPFAIKNVDAILATHDHNDHMDVNVAASVLKNCKNTVPFVGPQQICVNGWNGACRRTAGVVVKPGDTVKVGDIEILALESLTAPRSSRSRRRAISAGKCRRIWTTRLSTT